MAAKRRLHPEIRLLLETALLEALRRRAEPRGRGRKKQKAPIRRKKAGKKKAGKKRLAKKRPVRRRRA